MEASFVDELYSCRHLMRLHWRQDYWFGDFVRLVPDDARAEMARAEGDLLEVLLNTGAIEEDALENETDWYDLDQVTDDALVDVLSSAISNWCGYQPDSDDPDERRWSGDPYERFVRALIHGLDHSLDDPGACVTLLSRESRVSTSWSYTREMIQTLMSEYRALGWDEEMPRDPSLRDAWVAATNVLESFDDSDVRFLNDRDSDFKRLYHECRVNDRHPLFATNYSLFVPPRRHIIVSDPIEYALHECRQHPDAIRKLSPRQFEQFLSRIFESFGFDVQLTAQTRDGGADLICMSYSHGIPLKLAVEAKRYAPDRPITVELVRSFVGANSTLRANKLIYVTTSRYTRDAIKFARSPGLTELLDLKATPDIVRWAAEVVDPGYDHPIRHVTNR